MHRLNSSCSLSDKHENLSVNVDEALATAEDLTEGKMFIDSISRGGLVKPSDVMFVTCNHACDLIRYIRNNE